MAAMTCEGKTLNEIASHYNITKQAVSLLLKKAAKIGCQVKLRATGKKVDHPNYTYEKRNKQYTHKCTECEKEFQSKKSIAKTCSPSCRIKRQSRLAILRGKTEGKWSKYKKVILVCELCKTSFERTSCQDSISKSTGCKKTFCSLKCYRKTLRLKKKK